MIEIFAVKKSDTINEHLFNKNLKNLPYEIQNKITAKVFLHDREITLISQILLRHCLSAKLGVDRDELIFKTNEFDKPYLENFPRLYFNISHSGDYVVLTISDSEVGIDVEKERNFDFDIVDHFFSKSEIIYLKKVKESKKISTFFSIWTLKESYIKALGLGLNKGLSSFSVDKAKNHSTVTDHEAPENNTLWSLYNIPFVEDYHLAICHSRQENRVDSITNLPLQLILN